MSCVFIVTPLVMVAGGWPIFCAAAVTAAATLGYRKISGGVHAAVPETTEVEVQMEQSRIVADTLQEDEKIVLERGGVQVEFGKDARGRFSVHVRGQGIDRKTLQQAGEELIGRVRQQYAYQRLMTELEKRGYELKSEQSLEDKRIRIRLERLA